MPPKKIKRLLRLVDREQITVDEDGDVDGAEEAVEDLLEEFPELKAPSRANGDDDTDDDDGDRGRREPPGASRTAGASPRS